MTPYSSTLAWKIPWTEEPGRLQSMGLLGEGHDWETSLWLFTFMHWRRKWQPTPVFLPGESHGRGSLVGCQFFIMRVNKWLPENINIWLNCEYNSRLECGKGLSDRWRCFLSMRCRWEKTVGGGTKDNKCCSQVWEDLGSCPKSLKY